MTTPGQRSLSTFYESVQFSNPQLAKRMQGDVAIIAIHGLFVVKSEEANEAAERLRRQAFDLPEIHRRVLANALDDLGYS